MIIKNKPILPKPETQRKLSVVCFAMPVTEAKQLVDMISEAGYLVVDMDGFYKAFLEDTGEEVLSMLEVQRDHYAIRAIDGLLTPVE